ncbi:MAG: heme-binding protein [Planctomycetota bacterium]
MKWMDTIRDWFLTDDMEERPVCFDSRAGTTEILECRLVLGSLSTNPSALVPFGGVQTNSEGTGVSANGASTPLSGVQQPFQFGGPPSTTLPLQQPNLPPLITPQSLAVPDELSRDLQTTSGSSSSAIVDDDITAQTLLNSIGVPNNGNVQPPRLTTPGSPPVTDTDPLSTQSSPLPAFGNSNASSPPVAIDAALTAVNTNVFVTAEELAAAEEGGPAAIVPAWYGDQVTAVIHYDFRDNNGVTNEISAGQIQATEQVLQAWSAASGGTIEFVRDTQADNQAIVNIGVGDLSALDLSSGQGGTLGSTRHAIQTVDGSQTSVGSIWLDHSESWDDSSTDGVATGSVDFATVMAHEVGHIVGLEDDPSRPGIMNPNYSGPQDLSGITTAFQNPHFFSTTSLDAEGFVTNNMMGYPQLVQSDVSTLLDRASVATPSNDAIIAIVDRNGTILGVRVEQGVLDTITDPATLAFAIDGAVSKARTAAFFANDTAPLTSRTVRNLSQTTILQREVESNPNSTVSTTQGPGFVAPIGIGGHFPADIAHTPPVDLFDIEASNRDSTIIPGRDRFNIDPANVPTGQTLATPISYGTDAGIPGDSQNRGIATLPGGLPIFRDTNGDGNGDTLIGGIGVFFPGADGYATHEQGFVAGAGQTTLERTNSNRELEAEFIALAAIGGSHSARLLPCAPSVLNRIPPFRDFDLPFGFLTLNGVGLEVVGPTPGLLGLQEVVAPFIETAGTGANSGANQPLGGAVTLRDGASVPDGYLVTPHPGTGGLTVADMTQIIDAGIAASNEVRAAIRLGPDSRTGADGVRMTFAITDLNGDVLALYRMEDSTVFSIDVAVAKARNVTYYADATQLQPIDQVNTSPGGPEIAAGTAFTNRTFRFLAEPRYPSGVDETAPPEFSILNDAAAASFDPETGENIGAPAAATAFTSVMGHDVFNPGTNFHDPTDPANQNGIIFFPGSTPLYKNGVLVGGLGVSGDGVDQDDVVTFLAAQGFLPDGVSIDTADEFFVNGVRLPYQKFNRNPFG